MSNYSFKVNASIMDEVNAAASGLLTPPPNAVYKGDTKTWSELFTVTNASMGPDPKNPARTLITVEYTVPADAPIPEGWDRNRNATRRHTEWYRLNAAAIAEKANTDRTMTVISLSNLKSLCRAANLWPDGADDVELFDYFGGDMPMIVGCTVQGRVRQYKDKQGIERDDVSRFTPVE